MSLLAHLIAGQARAEEPAAALALVYLLNSSPDVARAFVAVLGQSGAGFEPGRIESELEHGESRPDVTIRDSAGRVRAFIENKFWAGLTEAQPVSYLRELPEDPPSALLFIVPEQRVPTVWRELKDRCAQASPPLDLGNESPMGNVTRIRVGGRTLLITSWKHILGVLLDAAHTGGHDAVRRDVLQLQGLTSRMDSEAFLPLHAGEVTDQRLARRLINYSDLVEDITSRLVADGVADTKGLRPTHGYTSAGRYLRVHARFGLWLGIDLEAWADSGITPLWWFIGAGDFGGVGDDLRGLARQFDGAWLDEHGNLRAILIRLATGVERDRVVDHAVEQGRRIADTLLEAFPEE